MTDILFLLVVGDVCRKRDQLCVMPGRGLAEVFEVFEALPGTGRYVKPLEQLRTRPDAGGWWAEALPGTGKRAKTFQALEQLQTVPGSGGGQARTRADLSLDLSLDLRGVRRKTQTGNAWPGQAEKKRFLRERTRTR